MKILFVDDEPLVLKLFSNYIRMYNSPYITYEFAGGGAELISKFRQIHPDIVFSDISMPGINGLDALDEIVSELSEDVSFYVFSGFNDFEYARHALRIGVKDYLSKPISYQVFAAILEKEEKLHYSGLSSETARAVNDEVKVLEMSRTASELAMAFSRGNNDAIVEYYQKWKAYRIPMEINFFKTHFGTEASTVEEQAQVIDARILASHTAGDSLFSDILTFVDQHFSDPNICLELISSEYNYSIPYLSSFFKKETGVNFSEYLTNKRITYAERMLQTTDLTVNEVAKKCGYAYANYFIKVFSKKTGKTPLEWRTALLESVLN